MSETEDPLQYTNSHGQLSCECRKQHLPTYYLHHSCVLIRKHLCETTHGFVFPLTPNNWVSPCVTWKILFLVMFLEGFFQLFFSFGFFDKSLHWRSRKRWINGLIITYLHCKCISRDDNNALPLWSETSPSDNAYTRILRAMPKLPPFSLRPHILLALSWVSLYVSFHE